MKKIILFLAVVGLFGGNQLSGMERRGHREAVDQEEVRDEGLSPCVRELLCCDDVIAYEIMPRLSTNDALSVSSLNRFLRRVFFEEAARRTIIAEVNWRDQVQYEVDRIEEKGLGPYFARKWSPKGLLEDGHPVEAARQAIGDVKALVYQVRHKLWPECGEIQREVGCTRETFQESKKILSAFARADRRKTEKWRCMGVCARSLNLSESCYRGKKSIEERRDILGDVGFVRLCLQCTVFTPHATALLGKMRQIWRDKVVKLCLRMKPGTLASHHVEEAFVEGDDLKDLEIIVSGGSGPTTEDCATLLDMVLPKTLELESLTLNFGCERGPNAEERLSDGAVEVFAEELPSLQCLRRLYLNLSGSEVSSGGLQALANTVKLLPNLEELCVGLVGCKQVSNENLIVFCRHLASGSTLQKLTVFVWECGRSGQEITEETIGSCQEILSEWPCVRIKA